MKRLVVLIGISLFCGVTFGQDGEETLLLGRGSGLNSRDRARVNTTITRMNAVSTTVGRIEMTSSETASDAYFDVLNSEWTQEAAMTAGTNGIYSIINPIYDLQNAYGLRSRLDLRDATEDTVHVNQLHAIDALINLNETKDYGVVDNISAMGVAIHGGGSTSDVVDEDPTSTGSLNLYYGVWGPTAEQNLDAETNGMVIVTHAGTYVDHGFNFRNSGTCQAGIYLNNHASDSPATMVAGILMESQAGNMTYGIDMSGAGITTADIRLQNSATIDNIDSDTLDLTATVVQITGKMYVRGSEQHGSDFAITDDQPPLLDYWAKTQEIKKLATMEFRDRGDVMDYIGGLEEAAERNLRYIVKQEARLRALEGKLNE